MSRKHTLMGIVIVGLFVSLLHFVATHFYFYWTIPWFDMVVHFFAGIWVALLSVWALLSFDMSKGLREKSKIYFVVVIILSTFIVGILWELFELIAHATGTTSANFVSDTTTDLLMDVCGAVVVSIYYTNILKRNEK